MCEFHRATVQDMIPAGFSPQGTHWPGRPSSLCASSWTPAHVFTQSCFKCCWSRKSDGSWIKVTVITLVNVSCMFWNHLIYLKIYIYWIVVTLLIDTIFIYLPLSVQFINCSVFLFMYFFFIKMKAELSPHFNCFCEFSNVMKNTCKS